MSDAQSSPSKPRREMGMFAIFWLLVGGGCLLFTVIGLVNTAFDLNLVFQVSGADVEVPDSYEVCAGLGAAGVLLVVLSMFGSYVTGLYTDAHGKPLVRVAIVVGALGLLVVVGRAVQIVALVNTYGSMLAYYATDGDLDDVAAELAKGPDREALDEAVSRAAQYDNYEALELLLDAGADFRAETRPPEHRRCVLDGVGVGFLQVALDHGVRPDSCPNSEALVWHVVTAERDDATKAKLVDMLAGAGWSTTATPEFSRDPPLALAEQRGMPETAAALRRASAGSPAAP